MCITFKLVSEFVLSKYPLCDKCYRTCMNLKYIKKSLKDLIYKDSEALIISLNVSTSKQSKLTILDKRKNYTYQLL